MNLPTLTENMPFADYLADPADEPSITSSVVKRLLVTAPAKVRLEIPRLCPDALDRHQRKFDLGTAAHALFVGGGEPLHVIEADSYRTKAAKEARDGAYATGRTPVLVADMDRVQEMAAVASDAFSRSDDVCPAMMQGLREASVVWREVGITARCRPDIYLPDDREPVIVHYKTTAIDVGDERAVQRLAVNMRWDIIHAHYEAGIAALTGEAPAQFFALQEVEPPYLCVVRELDAALQAKGEQDRRLALRTWASCIRNDDWPAHGISTRIVECPPWHGPSEWGMDE